MSPISSRKSVPPSARSKRPRLVATAPVNAPRTWPNSSLSSRPSGIAVQLIGRNGFCARRPWWCSVRATTSLPVPLSPVISTLASTCAARRMIENTLRIDALSPISSLKLAVDVVPRSLRFASSTARRSSARFTVRITSSGWNGLVV